MTASELLVQLTDQGVTVWVEGDRLRYRAPKGVLTPTHRAMLEQHKAAVRSLLLQRAGEPVAYPLSDNQRALWYLHQTALGNAAYHVAFAGRIHSPLDRLALQRACRHLIERHAILRTTYRMTDGAPEQQVHGTMALGGDTIDATGWSEETLRREVSAAYQRPFDLEHGPILRLTLFVESTQRCVVLLTAHHIAVDAWSFWMLLDELRLLYAAETTGAPAALPDVLHYTDFIRWQTEMLAGPEGDRLWSYWQQQLAGELPVLNLLTDRPRPPVQSHHGASHAFTLNGELTRQLKALAKAEGTTLYTLLLAAFQLLLHRYTGQDEFLVGSPTFGRSRAEFAGVAGCFMNPVVLRATLSGRPTVRALLRTTRQMVLDALEHQDFPFPLVAERLRINRDLSRSPLFQVEFMLQKPQRFGELTAFLASGDAGPRIDFGGLEMESFPLPQQEGQHDLTLEMIDGKDTLAGLFKYNTDLFDHSSIVRMLGHFHTLLEGMAADPDQCVSIVPLLSDAEHRQLLAEWSGQRRAPAGDPSEHVPCIHHLVEIQAAHTPDIPAVIFDGQQVTYRELNQRANQLAHHLLALGVGPETRVGLCLERSIEMVVGLLAILKAGGAYVPLDPAYPIERLTFMLDDAQITLLVTQQRLSTQLPASGTRVVLIDRDWGDIANERVDNPATGVDADHLAYLIYTSGSTGTPKGVMVPHRPLVHYTETAARAFELVPGDRVLQFATINFDTSAEEIYPCLTRGATLVLRTDAMMGSASQFLQTCREWGVSVLDLPTAYWHELTARMAAEGLMLPESLRLMIIGGEQALPERVAAWRSCAGERVRLVNTYGPTEATIVATMCELSDVHASGPLPLGVPIGRPIRDVQVYILDRERQPVPIGVPGELHIGGAGLARGYLNQPDVTAEKFIPHPFSDTPGARLYTTGDLARYRPDGQIEFLGRVDQQVKIRGFRIELGEIETAIRRHPMVRDAAVTALEEQPGQKRLVAYTVADTTPAPTVRELRTFLAQQLPDYMVPAAFVPLDRLPLTPGGKLDRRALPSPDWARPLVENLYAAPRTPVEEALAQIWARILGVERVGIHDNFFELGGDSIISLQIVARANQAGIRLTPTHLFQHPTIAELAAVAGTAEIIRAEQGMVTGPVAFTPYQRWFFTQEMADPHHWNMAILLEARRALDPDLVRQAVRQLLIHHDALRLRFVRETSGWRQVSVAIDESGPVPFSRVDLSTVPEEAQGAALEAAATELQASLNLTEGPIIRVALLELGPHRADRLLFIIHHMGIDGISWRILLEDFETLYQQLSGRTATALPPKTTAYQQWAQRLTEHAQSETQRQEMDYWLGALTGPVPALPADLPIDRAGANTEASSRTVSVALSVEQTRALLQEVPAVYRVQINDVLLTALVQAFSQWTGASRLLFDLEGHGREEIIDGVDLSRTVGCFTACFPVLLDLGDASDHGQMLKSVKEQLRRIPHRGIGYGILSYLSEERQPADRFRSLPQAEVSFNYLGQFDQVLPRASSFGIARGAVGPVRSPRGTRHRQIEILGSIADGQLHMNWIYSEQLHLRATIERLAGDYIVALRTLIAYCRTAEIAGHTPSDFPAAKLTQKDLDTLLAKIE